jgi:PGF-CTERM protein
MGPFEDPVEWVDDFDGTDKMADSSGIIVGSGEVSINVTPSETEWYDDYDPYPPFVFTKGWRTTDFWAIYPNALMTDYSSPVTVSSKAAAGVAFADLDKDGDLDMVQAKVEEPNTVIHDHEIWWGDGTRKWSASGCTKLKNEKTARNVVAGDFNGDGWPDLVFSCYDGSDQDRIQFWLNKGDGSFNYQPDITFDSGLNRRMDTGDLNNDGYDDVIVMATFNAGCYFGGPNGPDGTLDLDFGTYTWYSQPRIRDFDQDGYLDVLLPGIDPVGGDHPGAIYRGGPSGPDTVPDVLFNRTKLRAHDGSGGDINGDGYIDIVLVDQGDGGTHVYMGSSSGWNYEPTFTLSGRFRAVELIDLDHDGYDDLVLPNHTHFMVYMGGGSISSTPDIDLTFSSEWVLQMAVAVEKKTVPMGSFTTKPITKPVTKRWDILDLDGTVTDNRSVMISVLDEHGARIGGYHRLAGTNLDLSGLNDHDTISVNVKLFGQSNGTGPVLDRLLINWMDEWEWREEFYGEAKFAACQNLAVVNDELARSEPSGGQASGSYLGKGFGPVNARDADSFHTLRYRARLGTSQSASVQLVDATTSDVLAQTPMAPGEQAWDLVDAFSLKEHPVVQVRVLVDGLDLPGEFAIDDLWINWTQRMNLPPRVVDVWPAGPTVERTGSVDLYVNVTDEYDEAKVLGVTLEYQVAGDDAWRDYTQGLGVESRWEDGLHVFPISPRSDAPLGPYSFRVNVTDGDEMYSGHVEFSELIEVLPDLPAAPRELHATGGDSVVELEWRPPWDTGDSPILGYRIYRGPTNDSLEFLFTTGSSSVTYTDEDVENGQTYWFAVLAYTEAGNGVLSGPVTAMPVGPPTAPIDLSAEAGDGSVTLRWEPPEDGGGLPLTSYFVYKGPTELQLEWELSVQGTEHTFTDLVNGQTYYFAVSARTDVDEGPRTEPVAATPGTLPEAPRELTASPGEGEVTLSWKSPSDDGGFEIATYVIYRGETPGSLERLVERPPSSIYTDQEVEAGVTYHYAVAAVTSLGEGPVSEAASAMPIGLPGAPGDLSATLGDGQVTLSWSAPERDGGSAVTGYVIMKGTSPDDLTLLARVLDTLSYQDDEVTRGRTYHYAVAAVNEVGDGAFSETVAVVVPPNVPGRVSTLVAEAKGDKVTLQWTAPVDDGGSPLTGYTVLRGRTVDDMEAVADLGVVTSWTDEGLKRGATYYYTVVSINNQGPGEAIDEVEVKVPKKAEDSPGLGPVVALAAMVMVGLVVRRKR